MRRKRINHFWGSCFVAGALGLWAVRGPGEEPKPGNIAPLAKASASSSRPEYPLAGVNDNRMDTQWSTALGKTSGQWLQLDWKAPQEICGVVLHATGPWTQVINVQVERDGSWVSVGQSGSATEKAPLNAMVSFRPVTTKSVRFLFDGGAAYHEVEVYHDPALFAQAVAEHTRTHIRVAADLRGGLMGTVSRDNGAVAVREAEVTVAGASPMGSWKDTARTGENGEFEVALPFAATGAIRVATAKGDEHAEETFDCADLGRPLTPRPPDHRRDRVSLDGTWEFAPDPPKGFPAGDGALKWCAVKVPAHWELEGFVAESGRAVYRKVFRAPARWRGQRVKLRAEAVYSRAQVWVNGGRVGSHDGGFTPFEFDITPMVKPGQRNEVLVLVEARSMASEIDNASYFAYFELAGIWQPVEVFAVAPVHLSHLAVNTRFDAAYRDAELSVELDVANEQTAATTAGVKIRLFDPQGKELPAPGLSKSQVSLAPWDRQRLTLRAAVKAPQSWNAEEPRLYKLVARVASAGGRESVIEERFGFRQIEIKGRVFTLNGHPVKLRGISRLDAHPLLGRALTPAVAREDMQLIKEANFNLVRATIAPPHPASLEAADELGLYIENEGPACWGGHYDDLRCAPLYQGIMAEFLERDRNHPSVLDWSICNETAPGRVFTMTLRKMRSIDPTRAYSRTDDDGTVDFTLYHHPISLARIQDSLKSAKPVFFDEVIGLFHGMYDLGLFEDLDPGMRDYWITGLPEIERALNANENQAGAVQFSWVDDAFLVPGKSIGVWRRDLPQIRYSEPVYKLPQRGLVGDCVWGTVDGWRRPRPEYWLSKKLYSPVQIEEKPLPIPEKGQPIVVPVESWNQFADLARYLCRWELGSEKGQARAQAAPMSKGSLRIAARHQPRPDETLALRFYDPRGWLLDAYRLSFQPHPTPLFPNSGRPARIVEQNAYLDEAAAVRLLGPRVELAYDRTSGELFRALADREVVMTLGPKLHLQKSKAPMTVYPAGTARKIGMVFGPQDVAGDSVWHFGGADHRIEGHQAVLDWKGSYGKDFEGGFQIRMDDAGDMEFRYEFVYRGADLRVREIGLEFELPLSFDRLSWDRRAEYSCYPADHIGRPIGEAPAHPAVPQDLFGKQATGRARLWPGRRDADHALAPNGSAGASPYQARPSQTACQYTPAGARPYGLDDHAWGCNDFRSTKRNVFTARLTNRKDQGIEVVSDGTQHVRATVGVHDIQLKVLDFYGGTAWTYHNGYHYGPGRLIKTGDVLMGTVRLRFLPGQ